MSIALATGTRRSTGFVLLEVLVGMALFSVGLVAVLGSLQVSLGAVERSEQLLRATLLLDDLARRFSSSKGRAEEPSGLTEGGFEWSAVFEPWTEGEPRAFPAGVSSGEEGQSASDVRDHFEILRVTVAWNERGRPRMLSTEELVEMPEREDASAGRAAEDGP